MVVFGKKLNNVKQEIGDLTTNLQTGIGYELTMASDTLMEV